MPPEGGLPYLRSAGEVHLNLGEACLPKEGFHTSTLGETLSFFHTWSKLDLGELESGFYDLG